MHVSLTVLRWNLKSHDMSILSIEARWPYCILFDIVSLLMGTVCNIVYATVHVHCL
jgi:hypothetical protein